MKLLLNMKRAAIDAAAHEAATSPRNDRPEPTEAQKRAGNYKKGPVRWNGIVIQVENPKYSVRTGKADGKPWSTVMKHHYGYVLSVDGKPAQVGADDDKVDVFLGSHPLSEIVFVIDQVDTHGDFDEHKAVICATSEAEARAIYLDNYSTGWKGLGAITALTLEEFKAWLLNHDTKQPMAWNRRPAGDVFRKAVTFIGRLFGWFRPARSEATAGTPSAPATSVEHPIRLLLEDGQLLLKADTQNPGSRGSFRWYYDEHGKVRYGEPPAGAHPFHGAESRAHSTTMTRHSGFRYGMERVESAGDVAKIFRVACDIDRERMYALHLDGDNRATAVELVSQGRIDATPALARDILRNAVKLGTQKLALVHNHPSGRPRQSHEDGLATENVAHVASEFGIEIAHSIVVSSEGYGIVNTDGSFGETFEWGKGKLRGHQLQLVEGRLRAVEHGTSLRVFDDVIGSPYQLALTAQKLLDPDDKVALLIGVTSGHNVTAVFPIAYETLDAEATSRALRLAVTTGVSKIFIAAGEDGPEWAEQLRDPIPMIREIMRSGTEVLDFVVIRKDGYRSLAQSHGDRST